MTRISTCIVGHRRTFRGLFTARRERRWWATHNHCGTEDGHVR